MYFFQQMGRTSKGSLVAVLLMSFTMAVLWAPVARAQTDFTHQPEQTSEQADLTEEDRQQDMKVISQALERDKVKAKLDELGYTAEEIKTRLDRLSNERIHAMAEELEKVRKGSHLGLDELEVALLIVVIILAPILIPIVIIAYIFGHEMHFHHSEHAQNPDHDHTNARTMIPSGSH